MKCNICGAESAEGSAFCAGCGSPLPKENVAPAAPVQTNCPKCGALTRPDALFCPACGFRLKEPVAASPTQPAPPQPSPVQMQSPYASPQGSYAPQQSPYAPPQAPYGQPQAPYSQPQTPYGQQPYYGQPQAAYPQYAQPAYAPPRKKRRGLLVAAIIILLLVVAGVGSYMVFGDSIKRIVLGEKYTYAMIEQKNLKEDFEKAVDAVAKIGNLEERAAEGGHAVDLQLDLDETGLGLDPQMAAAIRNLTLRNGLEIDWVQGEPVYYNALSLQAGEEQLATLQIYTEGEQILVGLPEVLDQYIRIDPAALGEASGGSVDASQISLLLEMVTSMDMEIDRSALETSMMEIVKILLEHIDETTYEKDQPLQVGGVTGTYDAYTITLGSESAKAMVVDILTFVRDDATLYNLIGRMMSISEGGSDEPVDMAQYQSEIDEAIADIEAEEITDPFTLTHTAYVDKGGNIVGRMFRAEDEAGSEQLAIEYAHPSEGPDEAILFRMESEGYETVRYQSEYVKVDGKMTGTATIVMEESDTVNVSFSDHQMVDRDGNDYMVGHFEIMMPADAGMPVDKITMDARWDGDDYIMTLLVPGFAELDVTYNQIAASAVDIPDFGSVTAVDITDSESLQGLMTEDTMNKLMAIVEKMGLPLDTSGMTP